MENEKEQVEQEVVEEVVEESKNSILDLFRWKKKDGSANNTGILLDAFGVFAVLYLTFTSDTIDVKLKRFAPFTVTEEAIVTSVDKVRFVGSDVAASKLGERAECKYRAELSFKHNGRSWIGYYYSKESIPYEVGEYVVVTVNATDMEDVISIDDKSE